MAVESPSPGQRIKTERVTTKRGPGRTANITKRGDGKSSFVRTGGFRGKTAANTSSGMTTPGITKSSDGKTSFKRV